MKPGQLISLHFDLQASSVPVKKRNMSVSDPEQSVFERFV